MKQLITSLFIILMMTIVPFCTSAEDKGDPFDRGITNRTFIPKGQWLIGATINYSEHMNDNYSFLVLNQWDGRGHNFGVSPFFGYFIKDNFAIGGRFTYQKSSLEIDQLHLDLGDDINLSIEGLSQLSQTFYTSFYIRNYISLGKSNRFGLFNEVGISYGYGQTKNKSNGDHAEDIRGIFTTTNELNIGLSPGMVAFVNNNLALEVKMDVIGFNYKHVDQNENQINTGSRRTSSANFDLDIFSLNIGLSLFI